MPVIRLAELSPVVSPEDVVASLVPPPRFDGVRFTTYRPSPDEPSQHRAVEMLEAFASQIADPPRRARFRRSVAPSVTGYYLDGGFGVGKTHLLASLWHAATGPKVYGTFVEYTHLVGALGFAETVRRLSGYRLVAVDEFELDDPGDTMIITRLLTEVADSGARLAVTSNTLPDKLGEGRFAAEDFRREIHALASRFETIRVDGPDYRHSGLPESPAPVADEELAAIAERTAGASLDDFDQLTAALAGLHPSRYGRLVEQIRVMHLSGVRPMQDQASALRWVVLIDRLYDRGVPVRNSGARLDEMFTPEMLRGGYRKKYLRATSRLLALAAEAG